MENGKIKIGIDVRDLKISKTGAHTYLSELCNQINKQENNKFEYVFLDTNWPTYTGYYKAGKLYEQIAFQIWKQFILPLKAWQKDCKIVFCTDYFVPYIKLGFKTIPVFHDAFFWENPSHYNKVWLFIFNKIGLSAAKKASKIVTVTKFSQKQISNYAKIPLSSIASIYIGPKSSITKTEIDHNSNNLELRKWDNILTKRYILHVGTIEKRKNLGTLIKAFEQHLISSQEDIYLIIVGQKSNKTLLQDQEVFKLVSQSTLLHDRVIFTGYLSDNETALLYKNAALYVFPSVNEGFGIPILEAFAHQVPLLVANNSCLSEVAGPGAISFDPYNTTALGELISNTLSNRILIESLKQNGCRQLDKFSWKETLTQLESLFTEVLTEGS